MVWHEAISKFILENTQLIFVNILHCQNGKFLEKGLEWAVNPEKVINYQETPFFRTRSTILSVDRELEERSENSNPIINITVQPKSNTMIYSNWNHVH